MTDDEDPEEPFVGLADAINRVGKQIISSLSPREHFVPEDYVDYLLTPHWRDVRQRAIKRANGFCRKCRKPSRYLEVHHLTYHRIGAELESDVIAICRQCHDLEHLEQRRKKRL